MGTSGADSGRGALSARRCRAQCPLAGPRGPRDPLPPRWQVRMSPAAWGSHGRLAGEVVELRPPWPGRQVAFGRVPQARRGIYPAAFPPVVGLLEGDP